MKIARYHASASANISLALLLLCAMSIRYSTLDDPFISPSSTVLLRNCNTMLTLARISSLACVVHAKRWCVSLYRSKYQLLGRFPICSAYSLSSMKNPPGSWWMITPANKNGRHSRGFESNFYGILSVRFINATFPAARASSTYICNIPCTFSALVLRYNDKSSGIY